MEFRGNPSDPTPGDYRVQLLDGDGLELSGADFAPSVMVGDPEGPNTPAGPPVGHFLAAIPKPATPIASVAILHNGSLIGALSASANTPTVSIISPTGGERFTADRVTFEWAGSDADGDSLFYTVVYSANDGVGNTWNTLAVKIKATSLTVPRHTLAASAKARLWVIVSDGVNSTSAISNQFGVGNNPPFAIIDFPAEGAMFSGLQSFGVVGAAYDTEDGALHGTSLVWTSDIDGVLGTGDELWVNASDLTEGTHLVTLTATDSDGASSVSSAVAIQIFRIAPVP